MPVLFSAISFLFALALLITFHEFGHFWVARRLGVKVLRFSIGFGKPLVRWIGRTGTEYMIAVIPLGGYVKMLDESEGTVAEEDKPFAFNRQSLFKRTLIVLAGPVFNLILAVVMFWLMFMIGIKTIAPITGQVEPGSLAAKAGFANGDEIIAIDDKQVINWRTFQLELLTRIGHEQVPVTLKNVNDKQVRTTYLNLSRWHVSSNSNNLLEDLGISPYVPPFNPIVGRVKADFPAEKAGFQIGDVVEQVNSKPLKDWREFVSEVRDNPGKSIQVTVNRDGREVELMVKPAAQRQADGSMVGFIGLQSVPLEWPPNMIREQRFPIYQAWWPALKETFSISATTLKVIAKLVVGEVSLRSISGPIGIAKGAGQSASIGLAYYLGFIAIVSISLGILNLLPIPILDGGHLLYYLIEFIRGKPVSEVGREWGARIGVFVLFSLVIIAVYNDLTALL